MGPNGTFITGSSVIVIKSRGTLMMMMIMMMIMMMMMMMRDKFGQISNDFKKPRLETNYI